MQWCASKDPVHQGRGAGGFRIVQIDISVLVDSVNHQGILFKIWFVDFGGSVLSVLAQFLSNRFHYVRSLYVLVDGCRIKLVNVVSRVLQSRVLGPLLFLLYTAELFFLLDNKLCYNADDSTSVSIVPSCGKRVAIV